MGWLAGFNSRCIVSQYGQAFNSHCSVNTHRTHANSLRLFSNWYMRCCFDECVYFFLLHCPHFWSARVWIIVKVSIGTRKWKYRTYKNYFSQIIALIMNDLLIHTNFSSGIQTFTLVISYYDYDPTNLVGDDSVCGANSFSTERACL